MDATFPPPRFDTDRRDWVGPALTVGQLRELLEGRDPHEIVVVVEDIWWSNIGSVVLPDDMDCYWCVTLFPGAPFDSRQL